MGKDRRTFRNKLKKSYSNEDFNPYLDEKTVSGKKTRKFLNWRFLIRRVLI